MNIWACKLEKFFLVRVHERIFPDKYKDSLVCLFPDFPQLLVSVA